MSFLIQSIDPDQTINRSRSNDQSIQIKRPIDPDQLFTPLFFGVLSTQQTKHLRIFGCFCKKHLRIFGCFCQKHFGKTPKSTTFGLRTNGKSAILVEGARRVGKSTLVEMFAKNEYESYILIDFNKASEEVKSLFNDLMNIDFIFLQLQTIYNVKLFYYAWSKDETHNYEIDFLLSRGAKLHPIEVKSSGYKSHKSLDMFCEKFSQIVECRYLIYTKDLQKDRDTLLLPVYMTPLI